ncbi:phosphonate metabolism protein/1,5-bisphosphokinase (PRPP-forming) PhnN [Cupriavidus sp. 2TAF22]|uniref:phosphonate metabolism protein/1,5-bisphosphokinase (PRPP-forming) PhnN n=1 Tax=unclassified Cupriavidus TaxID=2640874 RepID=UPI003F8FA596
MTAAPPDCRAGRQLIYLMGPSGSGKDSLLRALRDRLRPDERVLIAHRYITRASNADEASVPITPAEFDRRAALGCFALQWDSHGLRYGIGIELDSWLAQGMCVVVNGSREYLPDACARYPALHAVQVSVRPQVLAQRLRQRGREDEDDIARRLARAAEPFAVPAGCRFTGLDNSGPLEAAAAVLAEIVRDAGYAGAAEDELAAARRS